MSEKLNIVTARERSTIEYHNALKEWRKMDAEISKVQRYVHRCLIDAAVLSTRTVSSNMVDGTEVGIYRNQCIRLGS